MSILIMNPWIITQNAKREISRKDVFIDGDRIVEIADGIKVEADFKIDGTGKILMPGLINTHTHIAMSSMRGLTDDMNLSKFLDTTFKLDANRSDDEIYNSAMLGMLESVRFGTTSILDLYYSEDIIANAAKKVGMRAMLAWAVLDKEFTTQKGVPLENAKSFIIKYGADDLVTPTLGLQGVYVCSDETLLGAMDLARKMDKPITMHLCETLAEVNNFKAKSKSKEGPIEHLNAIGFLDPLLIAAHLVQVDGDQALLLGSSGVKASHNPVSNMKLGSGKVSPVMDFHKMGMTVSLGTDSVASNNNLDMFQVMKCAALLQKSAYEDASLLTAQQALDFATLGGAKTLGKEKDLGSVEEGKIADLILIDPFPGGMPLRRDTLVSNVVYSLEGLNTDTTIINGKVVMLEKKPVFDLNELKGYLFHGE
jgi:5-methylthioadenosine/S-adenosylhomocysteine deaminase